MLLRSSSTPVLGSLLSSISESPNNHYVEPNTNNRHTPLAPTTFHNTHKKVSFRPSTMSVNSSSLSPSITDSSSNSYGFRRAQSESNLEALAYASCNNHHDDHFTSKPSMLSKCLMLETIPSLSYYEDEEESDEEEEENFTSMNMGLVKETQLAIDYCDVGNGVDHRDMVMSEMYLARGLGVHVDAFGGFGNSGGGGWRDDFNLGCSGKGDNDGNKPDVEEHYKNMVEENPCNSLFLRNYAQFLYQSKKDLRGAEEYYSRAILADPNDGDILSQYAKLIWELHRDEDRALSYFERAVQAAPEDSHVHAAYASFIWEIEEAEDDENNGTEHLGTLPHIFHGTMASAIA